VADERVDWFRREFAEWNAGERDLDLDRIHPEFELHSRMMGSVVRGAEGLQTWIAEIDEQFDAWQIQVDEEIDLGQGRYLLIGTVRLRGKGSGLRMEQDLGWRLEFEGEKLRLMKTYTDPELARAEATEEI
jgi:ketosteroid isomerase-like protein